MQQEIRAVAESSAKTASAAAAPAAVAKPAPGGGFLTPALGAPDAIEPPSRDIVPGMLVSAAKAKGAKADTVDYTLKWRPDTDLWINKDLQVIANLQVEYPAKDWDGVKAKWGKPAIGEDVWIGANWLAKLNGCANGPCGVTFVRSPLSFLDKTPVPPGALANLRAGQSPAQVKSETGYAISEGSGSDNGFGWDLTVRYNGDHELEQFEMDIQTGTQDDWLPGIAKLWGPPADLGGDKVWANTKDGWLVQYGYAGTLLRFHPMKPMIRLLAKGGPDSVLGLAQSLLGKPKAALATAAGYDTKRETFRTLPTEYSFSPPSIDADTNDKDAIAELTVAFPSENDGDRDKIVKLIASSWGPITTAKDEGGSDVQTIAVDGLKVKVDSDGRVKLTITK